MVLRRFSGLRSEAWRLLSDPPRFLSNQRMSPFPPTRAYPFPVNALCTLPRDSSGSRSSPVIVLFPDVDPEPPEADSLCQLDYRGQEATVLIMGDEDCVSRTNWGGGPHNLLCGSLWRQEGVGGVPESAKAMQYPRYLLCLRHPDSKLSGPPGLDLNQKLSCSCNVASPSCAFGT